MKIIKEGKIPTKEHQFECPNCGCIFIAEDDEFTQCVGAYNEDLYIAICPTCERPVYD